MWPLQDIQSGGSVGLTKLPQKVIPPTPQNPCRYHVMSIHFRILSSKIIVTSCYVDKRSCQSKEPLLTVRV